jgi:hypothetical protein
MRRFAGLLSAAVLVLVPGVARAAPAADLYRVTVFRVADNAYSIQLQNLVIVTQMCLSLALGDDAILNYSQASLANSIRFGDGTRCQVVGVYAPNANLTRVGDDLYKDTGGGGFLKTQFCYAYVYSEDALVLRNRVIFINSGESCELSSF